MRLTGVERARRVLFFEEPDRVPIYEHFRNPSAIEKVTGLDFWKDPYRATISAYKILEIDMTMGISVPYEKESKGYKINPTGYGLWVVSHEIKSPDEVVEYAKNLPSDNEIDESFNFRYEEYVTSMCKTQKDLGESTQVIGFLHCCFDEMIALMDYQNFFISLMKHKGAVNKIMDHYAKIATLQAKVIAEAKLVPAVLVGDDIAYNSGPMVSVEFYKEIWFPKLTKIIKPLKKAGIVPIFHSDGNLTLLLDGLVKAGIGGLHSIQPKAGMSLNLVKEKYGDKLVLIGNICAQTTLPFGTVRDVQREVKECISVAAPGSGYFLGSCSSVLPDVPRENAIAMIQFAKKYGKYPTLAQI